LKVGATEVLNSERDILDEKEYLLLEYQGKNLYFNELNLEELLKQHKTPLFVFSQKILQLQFERIFKAFTSLNSQSLKIAFSVKSNPLTEVAQTFMEKDAYFEVTSIGEVKHINALGGDPSKIIFTNIVKNVSTIEYCVDQGISLFAIDSWSDMKRIEGVCEALEVSVNILLRVNPGIQLEDTLFSCAGRNSKIGILTPENLTMDSQFKDIFDYCVKSKWLNFQGLHAHLGSQIVNLDQYREGMRKISILITQIEEIGLKVNTLDIGGGFPIYYGEKNVPRIESFSEVIKEVFAGQLSSLDLILESGRYLTAPAGILAVEISVIKEREANLNIACVNGSFYNTIPDVIIADWQFPIKKVKYNLEVPLIKYQIVGSSNDTLDYYKGKDELDGLVLLGKIEEKEYIVFLQAGAYSISFNSTYCMEERPSVYFIDN
jgi:diaminopimelate decarboxylase